MQLSLLNTPQTPMPGSTIRRYEPHQIQTMMDQPDFQSVVWNGSRFDSVPMWLRQLLMDEVPGIKVHTGMHIFRFTDEATGARTILKEGSMLFRLGQVYGVVH